MAKFFEKLSTRVKHQAPDFVLDEHPRFLEFVKQYYTFMESAEISVTSVLSTDGIQLESETDLEPSVLLLDANRISSNNTTEGNGDKVLQESSSYGKFEKGETITGATSGATGIIEDTSVAAGLYILSNVKGTFVAGETVTNESGNSATVKANATDRNGVQTYTIADVKQVSQAGSPVFTADTVLSTSAVDTKDDSFKLLSGTITFGNNEIEYEIDQFKKKCLIEGLDDIALSLEKNPKITEFEKKLSSSRPWIFND